MKLRAETSLYHWSAGRTNHGPAEPPSSPAGGVIPDKRTGGHHDEQLLPKGAELEPTKEMYASGIEKGVPCEAGVDSEEALLAPGEARKNHGEATLVPEGAPLVPGEIRVTGWAFREGIMVREETFLDFVKNQVATFDDFRNLADHLEGHYALMVRTEEEIWLACSVSRSYPLFYAIREQQIWAGDNPREWIRREGPLPPDQEASLYFRQFAVTPAERTLLQGLSQVRPGEIIRIRKEGPASHYFVPEIKGIPEDNKGSTAGSKTVAEECRASCGDQKKGSEGNTRRTQGNNMGTQEAPGGAKDRAMGLENSVLMGQGHSRPAEEETARVIRTVFARYAVALSEHPVLLPLTGGYDSRLLACLLKEAGHPRVTCATWGRPGNPETTTARQIAAKLGFPHLTVDYDLALVRRYTTDQVFNDYVAFAGHYSSMPFMQDYLAVRHLVETGAIPEGTYVLPGHPGDFLRGSHLYSTLPEDTPHGVFRALLTRFGTSCPATPTTLQTVEKCFMKAFTETGLAPTELFLRWDLEERQCKLIANSTLVFDFFGLHPVMPLFDRELASHLLTIPFSQQLGGLHYFRTLNSQFFRPFDCEAPLPAGAIPSHPYHPLREEVLRRIPRWIRKRWYPLKDDVFYREITAEQMGRDPGTHYLHPVRSHFYNCYLSQWYLHQVERELIPPAQSSGNSYKFE